MHFYDYHKIISYNCPVNILIGERGVGKSYGAKKYVINKFLKKGEQFLYLRRYDNELKSLFGNTSKARDYFDDIKSEFPDHTLQAKERKFFIDGECFGFAKRLTEAQDLKSSTFEKVTTIIFDEYAIEKNKRYYLPNEGMIIAGVLDSVIRNRNNIRIFILMNAVEGLEFSPLFTFFDLRLPYNNDIKLYKDNLILVQYMNNEEFRRERRETLIGKLMAGTRYENYAMKNEILDKNSDFIEKKTGTAKFSFAIIYNGKTLGIWNDFKNGKVYVSLDYIAETNRLFALTLSDFSPNVMMINALKRYAFWRSFIDNFNRGLVYFENQEIKHYCFEAIRTFKTY